MRKRRQRRHQWQRQRSSARRRHHRRRSQNLNLNRNLSRKFLRQNPSPGKLKLRRWRHRPKRLPQKFLSLKQSLNQLRQRLRLKRRLRLNRRGLLPRLLQRRRLQLHHRRQPCQDWAQKLGLFNCRRSRPAAAERARRNNNRGDRGRGGRNSSSGLASSKGAVGLVGSSNVRGSFKVGQDKLDFSSVAAEGEPRSSNVGRNRAVNAAVEPRFSSGRNKADSSVLAVGRQRSLRDQRWRQMLPELR